MPRQTMAFEIDDSLTTDQNLNAFAEALNQVDPALAAILARNLSDMSQDIAIDQNALLDALYAATAPAAEGGDERAGETA
jgi:hypothetical protein